MWTILFNTPYKLNTLNNLIYVFLDTLSFAWNSDQWYIHKPLWDHYMSQYDMEVFPHW